MKNVRTHFWLTLYILTWHVRNCVTAKVSVNNFKVEKNENLDNAFYVFTFLPRDALLCKARYCYRMSSVCLSVCLWSWWIVTSATGRPIHFMFGSRVGFSGTADLMALFSIRTNSRWRPPSWIISNISPQRLTIYLYSAHRAVIFAIAQLSCLTRHLNKT